MTYDDPALLFWSSLILKMIVTAAFVVVATVVAERSGPLIGGLITTLPISAGPVYIFLALDHSTQFLSQTALGSLAVNPVIAVYVLAYMLLAQRYGRVFSIGVAFLIWLVLAPFVDRLPWNLTAAVLFNAVLLPVCILIARPHREAAIPRMPARWSDIAMRALAVAGLVAVVVELSIHIGPSATGILAVFPIVITSVMFVLHGRVGGPAAAAVMANSFYGFIGLALALVALHVLAVPLGASLGLSIALAVSVGWSLLVWVAKQSGLRL